MDALGRRPSIMNADIPPTALMAQDPNGLPGPGGPPSSRPRARTNSTAQALTGTGIDNDAQEVQNERAVQVLNRVKEKLTGRDFKPDEELTYILQVDKLLVEATKLENLCQHYIGWCSFW
jgi:FKBP12-rapamycin complex-associated protein